MRLYQNSANYFSIIAHFLHELLLRLLFDITVLFSDFASYNQMKAYSEVFFVQNKQKINIKQWYIYPALIILLLAALFSIYFFIGDKIRFRIFAKNLFISELSGDTLSLHYTLAYPENYNLDEKAALPCYTGKEAASDDKAQILKMLSSLSRISRNLLSESDSYTYDLLNRYLIRRLSGTEFDYYAEPFSANSGIQSGLPILLADYTFRRKQDIEDYLSILDQTDEYFEGLLLYETEKSDAGLFMADYSAAKVIEQCDLIMDKKQLAEGTHFLHTTFEERISALTESGLITAEEANQYISENDRLLTTVVQPAYELAADTFTLLENTGKNKQGLYYFPQGRDYYEYLLSSTTGSDRPVSEIKRLLYEDFQNNYNAMLTLISNYPKIADTALASSYDLPVSTPADMLTDLQYQMADDFPAFPVTGSDFTTSVTVKSVSPSMEDYCSPAYYLTPPIDDMSSNIIYINGKNKPDSLTLYTTLAHEGYPGHLYQTVYSQLYLKQNNSSCIRYLLHYGGYVEGWALYVENLSYFYAQEQVKANPYAASYYEACRLNRNIHLCLYSLLDIAIHYDGATFSQVQEILQSIGITDTASSKAVYEYIVEEPVNYLKYYLGYMEIELLKTQAKALWGDEFSLYRFHKFILETGPSDFTGLNNKLNAS